ncbi:MAG: SPFH domain-containing protein [Patescibacteria group bacterium]
MNAKKVFLKAWLWLDLIITILVAVVLTIIGYYSSYWFVLFGAFLPSLIIIILRWKNKVTVATGFNRVYEWQGRVMEVVMPGLYFPFPYFSFLNKEVDVPINQLTLFIMTGSRNGLPSDVVDCFCYGSHNNAESKKGVPLRLMYKVYIECLDPKKIIYGAVDSYSYIAQSVESCVNAYVRSRKIEEIVDKFVSEDWEKQIVSKIRGSIMDRVGVNLISFVPVAIINTPEIEHFRLAVEMEIRKGEMIKAEINNEVKLEVGRGMVLDAKLKNMDAEKAIASDYNKIYINQIKSLKETLDLDGYAVLNFLSEQEKWKVFMEISKNGKAVYMDDFMGKNYNQRPIIVNMVR